MDKYLTFPTVVLTDESLLVIRLRAKMNESFLGYIKEFHSFFSFLDKFFQNQINSEKQLKT